MTERREFFEISNATATPLPPGGLCRPVGGFTDSGALLVGPPTADSQDGLIVCGDFGINPGAVGVGTLDNRAAVAYLPGSESPDPSVSSGDDVGSVAGSFYARRGKLGFVCVGGVGGGRVNTYRAPGRGCCGDDGTGGPPPAQCRPSVKMPCVRGGPGSGADFQQPCWYYTRGGIVYYECRDGSFTYGFGPDGTGIVVVCDGGGPLYLPGRISVKATNGTRSFLPIGTIERTVTQSGGGYPVSFTLNNVSIQGSLVYCCDAPKRGLYFVGTAVSLNPDPNESGGESPGFWCGCARQFDACPPCGQILISGPTYSPLAQVLRLELGCGTVDIVIGPCAAITDWQGPGYYCVEGCPQVANWRGPGYYCVDGAEGVGSGGGMSPERPGGPTTLP